MDTTGTDPNGRKWHPESHSHDAVNVELYFDHSEPNVPPRPIPPKHLAYLLEVKRLLEEREQQRREAESQSKG